MAACVVTKTIVRRWRDRSKRWRVVDLAFDTGDYVAGGVAVTPATLDLADHIDAMVVVSHEGYLLSYVSATGAVKLAYQDCDAVADGPLVEYPDAAMVANTVRVLVLGW